MLDFPCVAQGMIEKFNCGFEKESNFTAKRIALLITDGLQVYA